MTRRPRLSLALALLALAACADTTPTAVALHPGMPSAAAATLTPALAGSPHTPRLAESLITADFYAGTAGSMTLHYANGRPFATLALAATSLRGATLNGEALAVAQPVTITMSAVAGERYLIDLQPDGLRFGEPARLVIHYREGALRKLPAEPTVWMQETADSPWIPVVGTNDPLTRTITVPVRGFTRYMISTRSDTAEENPTQTE